MTEQLNNKELGLCPGIIFCHTDFGSLSSFQTLFKLSQTFQAVLLIATDVIDLLISCIVLLFSFQWQGEWMCSATYFQSSAWQSEFFQLSEILILILTSVQFSSVQFSSVAQSCPTLCDPMNRSTPGLPVHHQLLEFTQTQVHRVSNAIQPSHPWSSPSPPAPNPSQHQSLFQ